MFRRIFHISVIASVCVLLSGCQSLLLPDFNGGTLNPDIRFLRAGEVMNGVKCAMTAFMIEREKQIMRDRVEIVANRSKDEESAKRFLLLYGSEYQKIYRENVTNIYLGKVSPRPHNGKDNELNPFALNLSKLRGQISAQKLSQAGDLNHLCWSHVEDRDYLHYDLTSGQCVSNHKYCPSQIGKTLWDYDPHPINGILQSHCVPVPDYSRFALDRSQQASVQLTLMATNQGTIFYDFINQTGLGPLKEIIAPGNRAMGAVFPKAEFTAKGVTTFDMSVQIPQTIFRAPGPDSPYANDSAKSADVTTRLKDAIPAKMVSNAKSRATKRNEITIRDGRTIVDKQNLPFNTKVFGSSKIILRKDKSDAHVTASTDSRGQTIITPKDPSQENIIQEMKNIPLTYEEVRGNIIITKKSEAKIEKNSKAKKPEWQVLTDQEIALVRLGLGDPEVQFRTGCGDHGVISLDNNTEIDYLALKDMLLNVVSRQNDEMAYKGGPEVSLDTLNLTTSFEIVLDLSAGTKHIFRLFPMVLPPQMGIKPDHLHTLKITLHGAKKKGDSQNGKRLIAACVQRLQPSLSENNQNVNLNAAAYCATPTGQLLESLIETTDQNKGSSGAPGGATGQ